MRQPTTTPVIMNARNLAQILGWTHTKVQRLRSSGQMPPPDIEPLSAPGPEGPMPPALWYPDTLIDWLAQEWPPKYTATLRKYLDTHHPNCY